MNIKSIKEKLNKCFKLIPTIIVISFIFLGGVIITCLFFPLLQTDNWSWWRWIILIIFVLLFGLLMLITLFFPWMLYFIILRPYLIKLYDIVKPFILKRLTTNYKASNHTTNEVNKKINEKVEDMLSMIKDKITFLKGLPNILKDVILFFLGLFIFVVLFGLFALIIIILHWHWGDRAWGHLKQILTNTGCITLTLFIIEQCIFTLLLYNSKCVIDNIL